MTELFAHEKWIDPKRRSAESLATNELFSQFLHPAVDNPMLRVGVGAAFQGVRDYGQDAIPHHTLDLRAALMEADKREGYERKFAKMLRMPLAKKESSKDKGWEKYTAGGTTFMGDPRDNKGYVEMSSLPEDYVDYPEDYRNVIEAPSHKFSDLLDIMKIERHPEGATYVYQPVLYGGDWDVDVWNTPRMHQVRKATEARWLRHEREHVGFREVFEETGLNDGVGMLEARWGGMPDRTAAHRAIYAFDYLAHPMKPYRGGHGDPHAVMPSSYLSQWGGLKKIHPDPDYYDKSFVESLRDAKSPLRRSMQVMWDESNKYLAQRGRPEVKKDLGDWINERLDAVLYTNAPQLTPELSAYDAQQEKFNPPLRRKLVDSVHRASEAQSREYFKDGADDFRWGEFVPSSPGAGPNTKPIVYLNYAKYEQALGQDELTDKQIEKYTFGESLHNLKNVDPGWYNRLKTAAALSPEYGGKGGWKERSYDHVTDANSMFPGAFRDVEKRGMDEWHDVSRFDQIIGGFLGTGDPDMPSLKMHGWTGGEPYGDPFTEELDRFRIHVGVPVHPDNQRMSEKNLGGVARDIWQ